MLVLLLGGVDLLLLFLLATIQIASGVDIGAVEEGVEGGEDGALVDELGGSSEELLEGGVLVDVVDGLGAVEVVQEDLHGG